jgi:hypothetical protein
VRISRVVAAVVTVLALTVGFAVPAQAAETVSITVRIKDNWGLLTKGCVTVKSSLKTAKDCTVNSDGNFTFAGLPKTSYTMFASGFPNHHDKTLPTATFWSKNTYSTSQTLSRYGYLSGTLKSTTGSPIAGAVVKVVGRDNASLTASTTTSAEGKYSMWLPTAAYYYVQVGQTVGYGRYPRDIGVQSSTRVGTNESVVRNISMEPAGQVTGILTPPPGIDADVVCASIHTQQSGENYGEWCGEPGAEFTISDVTPGAWIMCVGTSPAPLYCDEDVPGVREVVGLTSQIAPFTTNPNAVNVVSGQTTVFNPGWGGTRNVKVQLDTGGVVSGGCLTMEVAARDLEDTDCSPVDGTFSFSIPADLEGVTQNFTLTDAENAHDTTWASGASLSGGSQVSLLTVTAKAMGTGSITVTATGPGGATLTSGCVWLYMFSAGGALQRYESVCEIDGPVVFDKLPASRYVVGVQSVSGSFSAWWAPGSTGSYSSATKYTLAEGEDLEVPLSVPTTQVIRGTVSAYGGGALPDGEVAFVVNGEVVATATPAADGTYEIVAPIASGKLRLEGFGESVDHWFPNTPLASRALTFGGPYGPSTYSSMDFTVGASATISGSLLLPPRIESSEACVYAVLASSPLYGAVNSFCGEIGDAFSLPVLPGNAYVLCLHTTATATPCSGDYATWEDFGDATTSIAVPAAGGDVPVTIAYGGTVRVTPTMTGGGEVTGGCARFTLGSVEQGTTCVRDAGAFVFEVDNDIVPGSLGQVALTDLDGRLDTWVTVPWVSQGATKSLTAPTQPWGTLRGTVTRPAGFDNTTICVEASDREGFQAEQCLPPGTSNYSVAAPPGTVFLLFYSQEPGVAFEWYNNKTAFHDASKLTMSSHGWVLNATLVASGTISGVVTAPGGAPALEGCANIIDLDGWKVDEACVNSEGEYAFENLPPGTYKIRFLDFEGLANEWFGGANFYEAATVTVVAGATATASVGLESAGSVSGQVTLDGDAAIGGCIDAVDRDGFTVASDCVDANGHYTIGNLLPGSFTLHFVDFDDAADSWSGGGATWAKATEVSVAANEASEYNFALLAAGKISGTVPDLESSAGDHPRVFLIDAQGDVVASQEIDAATFDGQPTYSFDHVPAGTFKVLYVAGDMYRAYYTASGSIAPTAITVPTDGVRTFTGRNISLYDDAWRAGFNGYLNVPSSWKSPVICAVAINAGGGVVSSDCGPRGGYFELRKLAPSNGYKVVFTNGSVTTAAQYKAFTGSKKWFGNVTTSIPAYLPGYSPVQYLPVWFYSDVTYKTSGFWAISSMGDLGVFKGYSDGSFKPGSTLTRRDFAVYLYKLAGSPVIALPSKSPFSDVTTTDPAYKALLWMRSKGYYTSTSYKPGSAITRKAEAVLLYKAAGSPSVTLPTKSPYTDVPKSDPAFKAVWWATNLKIVPKASSTTFAPNTAVTRGKGAAHLYEWWWRYGA